MRLSQPFFRLPVRFDAARLAAEVAALPAAAWNAHPDEYEGNSSVRLISAGGGENDEVEGAMQPTPHLAACPYLKQVLGSFGVVWSRSRLMRLAPGQRVPEHADINYHWFNRVRVHIPVTTQPAVRFFCGDAAVHMAAGEAWIFDNWRRHRVEHGGDAERVHLVADTTGSAAFWQLAMRQGGDAQFPFDPGREIPLLTERGTRLPVLPPAEVDQLLGDLRAELSGDAEGALGETHGLLEGFARDWRQLWALHGLEAEGRARYAQLIEALRARIRGPMQGLWMRTNRVPALQVLEARVLLYALAREAAAPPARVSSPVRRPLILIAAPRSGSTLLYETLAVTPQLWNLGGEAHWLPEALHELRPGAPRVPSNRLTEMHWTPARAALLLDLVAGHLRCTDGAAWDGAPVRLLEKTPKNALRIPFLLKLFPDAQFLFLWRDPRESLGSLIEAWGPEGKGRFVTYPQLPGFDRPWSFLLPPDWPALKGKSLEEIAAFQWDSANRIALDDLAALPPERWMSLDYAQLLADPEAALRQICSFADLDFDAALGQRCARPLPPSRYTQSPPQPDKWKRQAARIEAVLPGLTPTWRRLQALAKTRN